MEMYYYIAQTIINKNNPNKVIEKFNLNLNEDLVDFSKNSFLFYNSIYNEINKEEEDSFIVLNILYSLIYKYKQELQNNNKIIKIKYKFDYINQILNNIFLSEQTKEKYLNLFSKIQKTIYYLKKFGYICKFKKMKIQVDYDLLLNPINIQDKNSFCIIQDNFKFLFTIRDLINIIETALSNSPGFFLNILAPKNPFNNTPFSLSCLYNIYFKVKESQFIMPILFHLFFLCNFDKMNFVLEYEAVIRDYAIKKFIFNTPAKLLKKEIMEMLDDNVYTRKLIIDKDFPKETLGIVMKPFLYYYYIVKYSVKGTEKTFLYKSILYYKLKLFYLFNSNFGRKYFKIDGKKKIISFNTKHLLFKEININDNYLYSVNIIPVNNIINQENSSQDDNSIQSESELESELESNEMESESNN